MLKIKRILKIIILLINIVILFNMSEVLAEDDIIVVRFGEKNMYDAVISQVPNNYIIDRDESNFSITINQNDIVKIKRLELNDKNISKILGIENFTSLEYCDISNNKISDIKDLSGLTSLEYLDISNNKISKIEAKINEENVYYLKGLTSLKYLNMSNNKIDSLGGLNKLLNLEELYAYDNKIKSLNYIKGLTKLKKLNLSKNSIKDSDTENSTVTKFKDLINLQELDLSHNNIKFIKGTIEGNEIRLDGLINLKKLNLYDNLIHDLDGIDALIGLEELNLGENNEKTSYVTISNIDKLSNLINLTKFNFSENNTPNIVEHIKYITTIEYLQLEGNNITENENKHELSGVENLTSLKVLNLYNNKVKLIPDNFKMLSNLEELYLGSNSLKNLLNICSKNENNEYSLVLDKIKKLDISNNKYLYTSYGDYEGTTRIDDNAEMIEAIKERFKETEDTELNYEYLIDTSEFPHYDDQGIAYVTYDDFGAKCDGKYDDYIAIRNAHIFANEIGCEVRATSGKTYHIYKYYENPVKINTSVDWKNATFIIHDEKIEEVSGRYKNIFAFSNTKSGDIITIGENEISGLTINTDTKYIEKIKDKLLENAETGKTVYDTYLCEVINSEKKQFIRYGVSQDEDGNDQVDCFVIDKDGNVLNDIQWNFEKITKINLYPIPNEEFIIKNGNFISNAVESKSEHKQWKEKTYYERNIKVSNSGNVNISGITHRLSYEYDNDALSGSYDGFLNISLCVDVSLENCTLYSRKYTESSTYDLVLTKDVNVTCKNIKSNKIYDDDRWGIIGSNYCKDVVFEEGCELNRIDAHRGIYNLTVQDCILGYKGLRMTGQGELNLIRTEICADAAIELRPDYGSTWNGNVNIIDSTYKYDGSVEEPRLIYSKLQYDDNELHDFGYECKLPNLNIQNLTIDMNGHDNTEFNLFYISNVKIGGDDKNTEKEENTITYIKQYFPNKIEINGYEFENTSQEVGLKLCNNSYMESPTLEVAYSTEELTNEEVTVTIRANKEIQEVAGWERAEDRKSLTKVYTENTEGTETITVTDLLGNTETARVEVNNIDKEALTLEVLYSTEELTSENVTVTIRTNKEIQEVDGWTRVEDKKSLTKVYTVNANETVTVTDLYGNIATARVEVNNIDKEALTLEVLYSTKEITNENVTVTIRTNKEIQEVDGWTRGKDRKSLTKVYTENAKETVIVTDLYGNTTIANVEVNNIHKTTPIEEDLNGGGKVNDSSESNNSKISTNNSTEKNSILPKTGNRNIIILLLVIVSVIAIVLFVRYRNIKDI